MKKVLFTAAMASLFTAAVAQNGFFTKTCYRGAFAPAPTPMWTDGWTNWDPQNTVYPAPTKTVTGNITTNTTWSTGDVILLSAQCFVKNNSVLTIQPGVIVLGDKTVAGAGIFITKGSQLNAIGTASQPIIFTSNQAPGQRDKGDWGGIILLGKADNNNPNKINNIEGLPVSPDTEYGGGTAVDNNDNSGTLKYIRIEFPGYVYQPDKEINGLTFGAVGRGTTIDFIQVSYSNDDSYEWFGGVVNCKHLVAYRGLDDDFDTDNGFSGMVQFCLGVRDPNISDNPNVSTSEGFESDNDPSGSTNTPLTSAIFSNITDIGPLRGVLTATYANGFRRGARIRRNSNLKIYNTILMDHATRGLYIDGAACETNANSGALKFQNNIVAGYGQRATETGTFGIITGGANAWIKSNYNDTLTSSANILVNPYNWTSPDYRPTANSIALTNVSFTDAALAAQTSTAVSQVAIANPTTACVDATHSFTFTSVATVDPNYCSFSWSVTSGVAISNTTAMNPSFTIATAGSYTISLNVGYGDGAKTATSAIITTTCTDVGVKSITANNFGVSVYPNPVNDNATLRMNIAQNASIDVEVVNIAGKTVLHPVNSQEMSGEQQVTLNTSSLQNGIYFVTVRSGNSKETVKLVVNH